MQRVPGHRTVQFEGQWRKIEWNEKGREGETRGGKEQMYNKIRPSVIDVFSIFRLFFCFFITFDLG